MKKLPDLIASQFLRPGEEGREVYEIYLQGQLIMGNRRKLKDVFMEKLDEGQKYFKIDFTKVVYIDSSGLGVLVTVNKRTTDQGGSIHLSGLNDELRALFSLTKLDTLFAKID